MIDLSEYANQKLGISEFLLGITTGKHKESINFLFTIVKRYIFEVKLYNSMLSIHSLTAMVKTIHQLEKCATSYHFDNISKKMDKWDYLKSFTD